MTLDIDQLALVFFLAAGLAVIARLLRQPLLLAYLATGMIIGVGATFLSGDQTIWRTFGELGIMLLLFLIGLEINFDSLRRVGWSALVLGLGQIVLTFALGYLLVLLLGIDPVPGAYIALALTFSSTIIVVKVLTEQRDLASLSGKLSISVLLVQDLVAIIVLVVLAGTRDASMPVVHTVAMTIFKALILFLIAGWLGRSALPHLFRRVAHSAELLFLVSLAWVMVVGAGVHALGLSVEIGGFLAGLSLANSAEHLQIAQRIRPLRDFFILLFFVYIGTTLVFTNITALLWPMAALTLLVVLGKPLVVYVLMHGLGFHQRTNFLTSISLAQVSEFSLILIALALAAGHIGQGEVTLVTGVTVVTMALSSYGISHGQRLYKILRPWLAGFDRGTAVESRGFGRTFQPKYILIGVHRTGRRILDQLPRREVLAVDFDPDVLAHLERQGYHGMFGDVADEEVFHHINMSRVQAVISTSPDLEDNLLLVQWLQRIPSRRRPLVLVRAEGEHDARRLYRAGVDYVLLPHITAGQYLGQMLSGRLTMATVQRMRRRDQQWLTSSLG